MVFMCPVCGGSSFRATSWVSATKRARRGFECLTCGARVRSEQLLSKTEEARVVAPTIPSPFTKTETWRPPALRKPPAVSGTFKAVPSKRRPLKKQA